MTGREHENEGQGSSNSSEDEPVSVDSVFNLDRVVDQPTHIPGANDDTPSLGLDDEAALDMAGEGPPPLLDDSAFEPETIFDEEDGVSTPAPARELAIAPESTVYAPKPGDVLNERFEIVSSIAVGTLGSVYLVQDLRLHDQKALKLMHPFLTKDPASEERFIAEIKALQKLSHEHIIRVYDYGKTERGDLSYFTMEYVKGTTLESLLKRKGGRLPVEKCVALARQVFDTLAYMHQHGVSRNLKPRNVMIRSSGKIVLLNVGLSRDLNVTSGDRRSNLGTAQYQAPEQSLDPGVATPQVDIYSAGVLLYQMLTGTVPIGEVLPPSRVCRTAPRRLDRVVMCCLETRPENRYPSAQAARAALDRAEEGSRTVYLVVAAVVLALVAFVLGGIL